jgi:ketosteroid isomerase-like protein
MSTPLPEPVAAYFAATNRHDVAAMHACFAADAVAHDERADHVGSDAIRAWIEETTAKYRATAEITGATVDGDRTVVTASIAGSFPGSPVSLDFAFTLRGSEIARLEIG